MTTNNFNSGGGGGAGVQTQQLVSGSPFADLPALESWASSNSLSLLNSSIVSTAFVDGALYEYEGSEGVYVLGQWNNITPDALTPELMSILMTLDAVPEGDLPSRTAAGYESSGMKSDPNLLSTEKSVMTVLNKFLIGLIHSIQSAGENLAFTNQLTEISYHPVWQDFNDGNTAVVRVRSSLPELPALSDKTADLTNPTWSQPATSGDQTVRQVVVDFTNPVTDLVVTIQTTYVDGVQGDTWRQEFGDFAAGEQTLVFDPPFDIRVGQISTLTASSETSTVVVKGNSSTGQPYQRPTISLWADVPVALLTDIISNADQLELTLDDEIATTVGEYLESVKLQLAGLANIGLTSGRAFVPVPGNSDFSIDDLNLPTYNDKIIIYAAKIDKVVDVELPTNAEITSTVGFPVIFEPVHVGGTTPQGSGTNLIRFHINGGNPSLQADNVAVLHKGDSGLIVKNSAVEDWVYTPIAFSDASVLVPSGTFLLRKGVSADVNNLGLLPTVIAGNAFIVGVAGFGVTTSDVIVALVNAPNNDVLSDDWLVIVDVKDSLSFLEHVGRNGFRYDLDSNVFVNESNVIVQNNQATGVPFSSSFITPNSQSIETHDFGQVAIPISNLVGGTLTLEYEIRTAAQSGFEPEFREIKLNYGGSIFTFNILNRELDTRQSITIQIPNADYMSAIGVNPGVTLEYIERGAQWVGALIINSVTNMLTGTLHDPIITLIENELAPVQASLNADIASNRALINAVKRTTDAIAPTLDNPVLNLSQAVTSYLLNDVSVLQEDSVEKLATPYNMGLNNGAAGLVFEVGSPVQVPGKLTTADIGITDSKVLYFGVDIADASTLIEAINGGNTQSLMNRVGSDITVNQLVPAHGGGSRTVKHYPAPTNQIGYAGRWFTLDLTSTSHEPIADSEPFTNDLPTTTTDVTVYSQILANGNVYNPVSRVFSFGGPTDVTETFTEGTGAESVFVTVTYLAATRIIRVRAVPHVNSGLAIDDLQIRFEWTESVTEASFPESSRSIPLLPYVSGSIVLVGIKPSTAGNIIIVTTNGEIDTGYSYATYLGALEVTTPIAMAFDSNVDLNQSILVQLNDRKALPYFGLFTDNHTQATVLSLDTQLEVRDNDGNVQNALNHVENVDGKVVKASIVSDGVGGYEIVIAEL